MAGHAEPGPPTPRRTPLGSQLARSAARVRSELPLVVLDCLMVAVAYTALLLLRFDFSAPASYWHRFAVFLPIALVVHLSMNWLWGCYGHMWRHASVEEARRLLLAGACTEVLLLLVFGFFHDRIPLTVLVIGPVLATVLMGATRFQSRLFAFRRFRERESGLRVVVVGAGSGGAAAIREMQRNPKSGLRPVAVLDDDPTSYGRWIGDVRVVGAIADLGRVVQDFDAHQVLLAIPSGGPEVARRVVDEAARSGVPVRVLPEQSEWVHGRPSLREVRDLRIDDLLGRRQITTDRTRVQGLLRGRRVLVTGAGGSIGAELSRQVHACEPAALLLLDHDETHLHDAVQDLNGSVAVRLVDVRDRKHVDTVFGQFAPEVVFHAAAHKHVPLLEDHAGEAVATNVLGTLHVVEAAARVSATHLVHISTDKAARPTSVMGASKWLAEQIVLAHAPSGAQFCSVRFGNVLGSRGSVIPTFQRQIAAGGPVTVTDPRMTRYFMSTREAVSLVLQAAVVAGDDHVLLLDMGEQVSILELAERMITLCGYRIGQDIEIRVTGPRRGENLTEELRGPDESMMPTDEPSILKVRPVPLDSDTLDGVVARLAVLASEAENDRARVLLLAQPEEARRRSLRDPDRGTLARVAEQA
jgi:FlaA1/EpsC-like NDP-sugar epimerase